MSKELKDNREITMASASNHLWALQHASEELKNNYDIVLAAVSRVGISLQHASKELKNNYVLVMAAFVKNTDSALKHAFVEVKKDYEFVMAVFTKTPVLALIYASEELKSNYEFVMAVVSTNPAILPVALEVLRGNNEIAVSNELLVNLEFLRHHPVVMLNVVLLPSGSSERGRCRWGRSEIPHFPSKL